MMPAPIFHSITCRHPLIALSGNTSSVFYLNIREISLLPHEFSTCTDELCNVNWQKDPTLLRKWTDSFTVEIQPLMILSLELKQAFLQDFGTNFIQMIRIRPAMSGIYRP
jgi:hypothetical protein